MKTLAEFVHETGKTVRIDAYPTSTGVEFVVSNSGPGGYGVDGVFAGWDVPGPEIEAVGATQDVAWTAFYGALLSRGIE